MKALALALAATLLGIAFWIAVAFGGEQVTMALAGSDWADRLGGLDTIALLILLAGVPVHAAGLRVWFAHIGRPRVPLPWAPALLVTVASLAWWFLSLMLLYGLFGGDPARAGHRRRPVRYTAWNCWSC